MMLMWLTSPLGHGGTYSYSMNSTFRMTKARLRLERQLERFLRGAQESPVRNELDKIIEANCPVTI